MQKRKSEKGFKHIPRRSRKGLFAPIQFAFTTPVSLEECVHRLELEGEKRLLRPFISHSGVYVRLTEIDSDRYEFLMTSMSVEASGTLTRWEGTSTLLHGESRDCYRMIHFISFGFLVGIVIYAMLFLVNGSWPGILAGVLSILILIGLVYWQPYQSRLLNILEDIVAPEPEKKKRAGSVKRGKAKRKRS